MIMIEWIHTVDCPEAQGEPVLSADYPNGRKHRCLIRVTKLPRQIKVTPRPYVGAETQ